MYRGPCNAIYSVDDCGESEGYAVKGSSPSLIYHHHAKWIKSVIPNRAWRCKFGITFRLPTNKKFISTLEENLLSSFLCSAPVIFSCYLTVTFILLLLSMFYHPRIVTQHRALDWNGLERNGRPASFLIKPWLALQFLRPRSRESFGRTIHPLESCFTNLDRCIRIIWHALSSGTPSEPLAFAGRG